MLGEEGGERVGVMETRRGMTSLLLRMSENRWLSVYLFGVWRL